MPKNLVNFGPKTAENGCRVFAHPLNFRIERHCHFTAWTLYNKAGKLWHVLCSGTSLQSRKQNVLPVFSNASSCRYHVASLYGAFSYYVKCSKKSRQLRTPVATRYRARRQTVVVRNYDVVISVNAALDVINRLLERDAKLYSQGPVCGGHAWVQRAQSFFHCGHTPGTPFPYFRGLAARRLHSSTTTVELRQKIQRNTCHQMACFSAEVPLGQLTTIFQTP